MKVRLDRYERNGEITNYFAFRIGKDISDATFRNEMVKINNFVKYYFADSKVTHLSAFKFPPIPKKITILMEKKLGDKHLQVINKKHLLTQCVVMQQRRIQNT